ncbi:MAG TPA: hypothetical protein VEK08_21770 [Planctomycetota bacterium]|nr:hypothetical protein [Planctomycetota bacterium]
MTLPDSRFLRWTLSGATVAALAMVPFLQQLPIILPIGAAAFGIAATLYYGHMLFARLQCSLLELIVAICFAGNVIGLLFTVPGVSFFGWVLVPVLIAWTTAGAASGIIYARVLQCEHPFHRSALLLLAWLEDLALPLVTIGGVLLSFGQNANVRLVLGQRLMSYAWPCLVAGVVLFIVSFIVHRRIRKAARRLYQPVEVRPVIYSAEAPALLK